MSRPQPAPHARRSHGLALLATALLALSGQLGAAGHLLLVPHRECSQHGLEHAAGEPVAAAEAPAANPAADLALQERTSTDHGDEACLFAQLRKEQLAGPTLATLPRLASLERAPITPGRSALPRHGAAILRLAPKGSPPV